MYTWAKRTDNFPERGAENIKDTAEPREHTVLNEQEQETGKDYLRIFKEIK